jgi:hypothetical protein
MISILIAGDLCPNGKYQECFRTGNIKPIKEELSKFVDDSDIFIANLECPLTDSETPIPKIGPNLRVHPDCIKGVKELGIDVLNLANNHIYDHGQPGIVSTLKTIDSNGVDYFGAGTNTQNARKLFIKEVEGKRIAFYGCTEKEFSNATRYNGGANGIDLISFHNELSSNKGKYDNLFVIVHGGKEFYHYPSPNLQRLCRHFVDSGVSAVIVQHTHCIGSHEIYNNCPIFYGQGNFIFDAKESVNPDWWSGYLIKFRINESMIDWEMIPFRQSQKSLNLEFYSGEDKVLFDETMEERNLIACNPDSVKSKWEEKCISETMRYSRWWNSFEYFFTLLYNKLKLEKLLKKKNWQLTNLNIIQCETHRETLETILNLKIKNQNNK